MKILNLTRLNTLIKTSLQRVLGMFGLGLIRLKPFIVLTEMPSAGIEYVGYLMVNKTVVVSVKLSNGRGLPLFQWGQNGNHPFSIAIKNLMENAVCGANSKKEIFRTLSKFYAVVSPESMARFFKEDKTQRFEKYPAWSIVMPWEASNIDEWAERVRFSVGKENAQTGNDISITSGWAWAGPVETIKCEIESTRLQGVFNSILKRGYQRKDSVDGDILADILIGEKGSWVWQSVTGQHRVAVLSGLGYEACDVRIRGVVRRVDVLAWPNVVNGFYTEEEALEIFDSIFFGNFSTITKAWDDQF